MPLVKDANETREIYNEFAEKGVVMPAFNTEDFRHTETTIKTVSEFAKKHGIKNPPVTIAFTASYHERQALSNYCAVSDDHVFSARMIHGHIDFLCNNGPYKDVRVLLHLDHGQPDTDKELLYDNLDLFATVMFDASHNPLDKNMEMTAKYVEETKGKVLVEGAIEELVMSRDHGTATANITSVEEARKFVDSTGVAIVVPNLGTEHQATSFSVRYRDDRAREIAAVIGKMQCLHGTSSLSMDQIVNLADDGIIKVNLWTKLATTGAMAVADYVIRELGNILLDDKIKHFVDEGYLGPRYLEEEYIKNVCEGQIRPKNSHAPEVYRRQVWVKAVQEVAEQYLGDFNYARLAG